MSKASGTASRIPAIVRGARSFRGVPDAVVESFAREATTSAFKEGELLWRAGQPAQCFTIIVRGLVQIQRPMPSGDEAIVGLFGPHESVGDAAAIEGAQYPASALAVSEAVEVVRLPAQTVRQAMSSDLAVMQAIQRALLDHTRALQAKIDIVSAGSVSARLATLLLYLAERFGDEDEQHVTRIGVPLSRTALARLVSARSETVIRMLSQWDKQDLLHTEPEGFAIPSLQALREIAQAG